MTKEEAYIFYDVYHNGGVQDCNTAFSSNLIESGLISTSYNSSNINISDFNLSGSDKFVQIYSEGTITLVQDIFIGNGAKIIIGPEICPN